MKRNDEKILEIILEAIKNVKEKDIRNFYCKSLKIKKKAYS